LIDRACLSLVDRSIRPSSLPLACRSIDRARLPLVDRSCLSLVDRSIDRHIEPAFRLSTRRSIDPAFLSSIDRSIEHALRSSTGRAIDPAFLLSIDRSTRVPRVDDSIDRVSGLPCSTEFRRSIANRTEIYMNC